MELRTTFRYDDDDRMNGFTQQCGLQGRKMCSKMSSVACATD